MTEHPPILCTGILQSSQTGHRIFPSRLGGGSVWSAFPALLRAPADAEVGVQRMLRNSELECQILRASRDSFEWLSTSCLSLLCSEAHRCFYLRLLACLQESSLLGVSRGPEEAASPEVVSVASLLVWFRLLFFGRGFNSSGTLCRMILQVRAATARTPDPRLPAGSGSSVNIQYSIIPNLVIYTS